jgi:hypothetical protein
MCMCPVYESLCGVLFWVLRGLEEEDPLVFLGQTGHETGILLVPTIVSLCAILGSGGG